MTEPTEPQTLYCYGCSKEVELHGRFCSACGFDFQPPNHNPEMKGVYINVGVYDPELAVMQFLRRVQEQSDKSNRSRYVHDGDFGILTRDAWQRIAAWVQRLADELPEPTEESREPCDYSYPRHEINAFVATLPKEHQNVFSLITRKPESNR
jgi:hypothetical protein